MHHNTKTISFMQIKLTFMQMHKKWVLSSLLKFRGFFCFVLTRDQGPELRFRDPCVQLLFTEVIMTALDCKNSVSAKREGEM